jgi:hypothetical protein
MPDYNGQSFVGQVWHPGANFSPFHPLFLQRLQPFGTLRFMQVQETITSQIQHWSDLRGVDYETQTTDAFHFQNGIAPEYMIELANELHANIWVNMPHMADDDFVTRFATLVRNTLDPKLKVYVEWSNEVWNGAPGFIPHQWILQQLALPQNAGVTFPQFVAQEDRRVFADWEQVFAGQTGRVVRVVAGFENNPGYIAQVLQNMNGEFDAVSAAAYFGPLPPQQATYNASTSETQVMNDTIASIPTELTFLARHKALADQYAVALNRPIQFVAYEGGASLVGNFQPYQPAYLAASSDPRMYDAFTQLLTGLNNLGMNLFVNYVYTDRFGNNPYGDFGALSYMDEPIAIAPKYRALLDAAQGTSIPPPTLPPGFVLNGNTLTVTGNGPNDTFRFTAGALYLITLDSVTYQADPAQVRAIVFVGQGANEAATVTDAGAVQAQLHPGTAHLAGNGYTLDVSGMSAVVATGGAGSVAYLYDGPGADVFVGTPTYAYIYGNCFFNQANGFPTVVAVGAAGNSDTAVLVDGPGANVFVVAPTYAYFQGAGFTNEAIGFRSVLGVATPGSNDFAYLFGGSGNNTFVGTPTYAYLAGAGFYGQANGFRTVVATAGSGGTNVAYLFGTGGAQDVWYFGGGYAYLYGTGFFNLAQGFGWYYSPLTGWVKGG